MPRAALAQARLPVTTRANPVPPLAGGQILSGAAIYGIPYGRTGQNYPTDATTLADYIGSAGVGACGGKYPAVIQWGGFWAFNGAWDTFNGTFLTSFNAIRALGCIPLLTWQSYDGFYATNNAYTTTNYSLTNLLTNPTLNGSTVLAFLQTFASQVAAWGHPCMFRFDQEMNANTYPYATGGGNPVGATNTAARFVQLWQWVRGIFDAAGCTNVSWVWCTNGETGGANPVTDTSFAANYPGDTYVDWNCVDIYNNGDSRNNPAWKTFNSLLTTVQTGSVVGTYAAMQQASANKPLGIIEFGSNEDVALLSGLGVAGTYTVTCNAAQYLPFTSTPQFTLAGGDTIVIDTGANQESVVMGAVSGTPFAYTFSITTTKTHAASAVPIIQDTTLSSQVVVGDGTKKAAWLTDALGTQIPTTFPLLKMVCYWNGQSTSKNYYAVESTPTQTTGAWRNGIAAVQYATNSFGGLAVPTSPRAALAVARTALAHARSAAH